MAGEIKLKFSDDSLKSIEQINRGLGEVFNSVKELNKTSININKGVKENAKDLRKLSEDEKVLLAVQKERDKTIQTLINQEAKLALAQSEQGKQLVKLRTETNLANKEAREQAKEELKLVSAFDKLQKELKEAEKAYKDLAISQGHSSKATKDALRNVNDLRSKVDAVNQPIGRFNDNVGNYRSAFDRLTISVKNLLSAFGLVQGIYLFVRAIKDAGNIVSNFDTNTTNLANVLGKTKNEIPELIKQAKELGATTAFSANDVLKLQESYARLGFEQQKIIDLTPATINGALALRANADETATLVGAIVKSFQDLESQDAPKIIDELTASTQKSALDFGKLQTAIPIVAGAANSAGIPFTKLLALLGKLSDAGIDASSSATALRNIFIESASQGKSYEEILETIVNKSDQLTASTDEFGKRAAVSGTILANSLKETDKLYNDIAKSQGTADKVANESLKTISGQATLLKSAWEGFILSLDEGDGVMSNLVTKTLKGLTDGLTFATENTDTLKNALIILTATYALYNAKVILATISTIKNTVAEKLNTASKIASNVVTKSGILLQSAYSNVVGVLTGRLKLATVAKRAFALASSAMSGGLTLVIAGIVAMAGALLLYVNRLKDADKIQKSLNDAHVKAQRNLIVEKRNTEDLVKEINKENTSKKRKKELLDELNEKIPDYIGYLTEENINQEEGRKILEKYNEALLNSYILKSLQEKKDETIRRLADETTSSLEDNVKWYDYLSAGVQSVASGVFNYGVIVKNATNRKKENIKSTEDEIKAIESEIEKYKELTKAFRESEAETEDKDKEKNKDKEINKTLLERIAILQQEKQKLEENIEQINKFLASGKATTENQQALNNELNFYQDKLNDVNGDLESFGVTYKKVVDWQKQLNKEIQGVTDEYTEFEDALVKAYKNGEISAKEFLKAVDENSAGLDADILKTTITNLEKLLGTEIASADEREEIERKLYEAKKALRGKELQDTKDLAKENIKTDEEGADAIAKGIEKRKEIAMQAFNDAVEISQMVTQAIFDNKIAKLEEEYNETVRIEQEKQDYLASLLENGAISQEQYNARKARSDKKLADEQKKLEYEKAKAERNQALITAAINTAAAIVQAIAQFGPPPSPAGIAGIASAAIIGATQIALIASKKIPQYAKGKSKHDSYEGIAEVAEKGAELVNYADGSSQLFSKPTYTYLPKGTEVLTANKTRKELQEKYFDSNSTAEIKGLRKDLKKKNFNVTVINNGYDFSLQKYLNERV